MNSRANTLFNRHVEVAEIKLVKSQLIWLRATIVNTGKTSWNKLPLPDRGSTYQLGYRLSSHSNSFPPVEKFLPLPVDIVVPGQRLQVEWHIPVPHASVLFKLEIDVISTSQEALHTWFSEMGIEAATLELKTPLIEEGSLPYRSSFSEVVLRVLSPSFVMVSGFIKNVGSETWNSSSAIGSDFYLGLRAFSSNMLEPVQWEGRGHLEKSPLAPGEESPFSALISADFLKRNTILKLCMLRERHFWFDEFSPSSYLLDLTDVLHQLDNPSKRHMAAYRASILPQKCLLAEGFLIQISGELTNSGTKVWNPVGYNRSQPIALGIRIAAPNSARTIRESRAALPTRPITPGETLPFSVTLSALAIPPGEYIITVDLVYESVFWFSNQGSDAVDLGMKIAERRSLPLGELRESQFTMPVSASHRRILFISPVLPLFDKQAGGKRLFNLLKILRDIGFEVDFFYETIGDIPDPERYLAALASRGIFARQEILLHLSSIESDRYDICILAWYECAERYMPIVRSAIPHAKVIIDTVDIHWVREQRGVDVGELSFTQEELHERKIRETTIYREADLVWVVTESDRQALIEHDPAIQHQIVPLIYSECRETIRDFNQDGILFVGGFRHPPNTAAARRGAQICAQFRAETGRKAPFYIVGDAPPPEIIALQKEGETEVVGFVEDLNEYYNKCRVVIAPLQSGAGMKGKVCDAAYAGLPIITSHIGAEGLHLENQHDFFLAETDREYVEALKQAFHQQTDLASMCHHAFQKIARLTSESSISNTISAGLLYRPVVIAIVSWNRCALLKQCIDSILEKTRYPDFKIAVVSNGCTDGTRDLLLNYQLRFPKLFDLSFNSENQFFVKPNNFIIEKFPEHDVVMLNNDVQIVSRDWLTSLYHGAYCSAFVGAAGGLTLDSEGKVSEAGADVDLNGFGHNIGRGANPQNPELQISRYVPYCSGCLLYLRRDVLNQFGPLNEDFHPMYYEDVEWQYRIKSAGYKTIYIPQCVAIHHEGSSAGVDLTSGMKTFQEINRIKFLATGLLQQSVATSPN